MRLRVDGLSLQQLRPLAEHERGELRLVVNGHVFASAELLDLDLTDGGFTVEMDLAERRLVRAARPGEVVCEKHQIIHDESAPCLVCNRDAPKPTVVLPTA